MIEVNALSEVLRQQRLGALEANALLRTVMEEIDLAVFTFDALQAAWSSAGECRLHGVRGACWASPRRNWD